MQFSIGSNVFSKGSDFIREILATERDGVIQVFLGEPRESVKNCKILFNEKNTMMIANHVMKKNIQLFVHSRFMINLSRAYCSRDRNDFLLEYKIADSFGAKGIVIHINGSRNVSNDEALNNFKAAIVQTLKQTKDAHTKILLETSSGHGQELLSELPDFLKYVKAFPDKYQNRIGICIDTCHVFAAGYDLTTVKKVKDYFSQYGNILKKVYLIHFNDSYYPCGSKKDHHSAFGSGYITQHDFLSTQRIMQIAKFHKIPLILERTQTDNLPEIFDLISLL